jgi:hypothetical protein
VSAAALSPKDRRVLSDMAAGGLLYEYVDSDYRRKDWPKPGSGALVYDGPPTRVSQRMVRRLRRLGTKWDGSAKAEVMTEQGAAKARALVQGRDVIWVASALPSPRSPA